MAIKYVSGKTRELKVGLSSYSEGKPSLQVTGNVGVGTTNPLSLANPANTSVISAGIVTANKLYGDIVAAGVGITNLFVSGISTFIGNVHVSAAGTVGFGTTAYFGYNNDFKIWDNDKIGSSSEIHTRNSLQLKSTAPSGFVGIKSEVTLTFGMGTTYWETDLFYLQTTSGQLIEADARAGGFVRLKYGGSTKLTTRDYGIDVSGHVETDTLNVTGLSTFVGVSSFVGLSTFAGGVYVSGVSTFSDNVHLLDNDKLLFGGSAGTHDGLEIFHDSNHSFIKDTGSGHLYFQGSQIWIADVSGTTPSATFSPTSDTKLYYTGSEKIRTTGYGISVTGGVNATGISTFNDDVVFNGNSTNMRWDHSTSDLILFDATRLEFGSNKDFEIWHGGAHTYMKNSGGDLRIRGDKILLKRADDTERYLEANVNNEVKLFFNGDERFRTTGIGISVVGVGSTAYIEGPDNIIIDPHPYGIGATSGNVFIRGDLYVEGTEFIVDVDKIELGDFQIGIATTAGTNALLDGAGIGIGSTNIRKFITWNNATNALMTSENWNLASGKHYEINGTDVLTSDTLLVGTGASVHSPSNNILTLHTNGAEKLRIDASGNLGIGTAVPTDSANIANTSVTSAGIVTAVEYYGIFKGSIPGFSTVFSSGQGQFSATPGQPQTIDTFAFSTHDYQIAEYTLHFVHANGIQAQKALVMQDNSVAYSNEYGVMYDSELLVSIAATVSSGNVNITATPEAGISGVTTFRWRREVQT